MRTSASHSNDELPELTLAPKQVDRTPTQTTAATATCTTALAPAIRKPSTMGAATAASASPCVSDCTRPWAAALPNVRPYWTRVSAPPSTV